MSLLAIILQVFKNFFLNNVFHSPCVFIYFFLFLTKSLKLEFVFCLHPVKFCLCEFPQPKPGVPGAPPARPPPSQQPHTPYNSAAPSGAGPTISKAPIQPNRALSPQVRYIFLV